MPGSASLRVLHHGEVVHTEGRQDLPMPIHSMRKSFISALFGRLVDEGLRLDSTLSAFGIDDSPELTSIEKSATLDDLLTSRSGVYLPLRCGTSFNVFTNAPTNWPTRGSSAPGTRFFYSNWDFNVLGEIYQRASGTALFVAFDRLLAQPLGFRDWDALKHSHLRYGYDPLGATTRFPNYAMELSARDLAAFGQLYLDEGCLRGDQLLSPGWVRRSTRPLVPTGLPQPFAHYGYLWWVSTHSFSAVGLGGQSLSIVPSQELVIVAMNDGSEGSSSQMGISDAVMRAMASVS